MNYYLDTEFLEGIQKTFLGKTKPTIDLISIDIVSEDDREYYAISKDFNLKEAWNRYDLKTVKSSRRSKDKTPKNKEIKYKEYWIRENVLKPIFEELYSNYLKEIKTYKNQREVDDFFVNIENKFTYNNLKKLINKYGKPNKEIALEIEDFVLNKECENWLNKTNNSPYTYVWDDEKLKRNITDVNFYTYYGDYDWVVFCWLFGKMIDLPKGFPMYARDLKQELDRKIELKSNLAFRNLHSKVVKGVFKTKEKYSFNERVKIIKSLDNYPVQENEHNALSDANWNKKLHEFLTEL